VLLSTTRCPAAELRAVINGDGVGKPPFGREPIEALNDSLSGQRESRFEQRALAAKLIDEGQDPERSAVC